MRKLAQEGAWPHYQLMERNESNSTLRLKLTHCLHNASHWHGTSLGQNNIP